MWAWYVQIVKKVLLSRNMKWKQWYLGSKASGLLFGVTGGMDFKSTQQMTSTSCLKQATFAAGNPLSFLKSNSSFGILTNISWIFQFLIFEWLRWSTSRVAPLYTLLWLLDHFLFDIQLLKPHRPEQISMQTLAASWEWRIACLL